MPLAANTRGIIALTVCTAVFAAHDLMVKQLVQSMPTGQVIFTRGVLAAVLLATVFSFGHSGLSTVRAALTNRIVLARAATEGIATSSFTVALLHVQIAEASAISMMSPLIMTGLLLIFFKESVNWRNVVAIFCAFLGALLVVKPSPHAFNPWFLLPLFCAFAAAGRDLLTRHIDPNLPVALISLLSAGSVALVGLAMTFVEGWRAITFSEFAILGIMAALLAFGNFTMVIAYRGVDVTVVVPFRYSYLVWAGIGGVVFFNEFLDPYALGGTSLIVLSGIYTFYRERLRQKGLLAKPENDP